MAEAMIDARGKEITQEHVNSVRNAFGVTPLEIAMAMEPNEVCDDVREILQQIAKLCEEEAAVAA